MNHERTYVSYRPITRSVHRRHHEYISFASSLPWAHICIAHSPPPIVSCAYLRILGLPYKLIVCGGKSMRSIARPHCVWKENKEPSMDSVHCQLYRVQKESTGNTFHAYQDKEIYLLPSGTYETNSKELGIILSCTIPCWITNEMLDLITVRRSHKQPRPFP